MKNLLLVILLGSFLAGSTTRAFADGPDATAARLYRLKCAQCHGADGEGGIGASLKGKLRHHGAAQLFDVIKNGIPSTEMPASGLPDPQVKKKVAYVLYLNKRKP